MDILINYLPSLLWSSMSAQTSVTASSVVLLRSVTWSFLGLVYTSCTSTLLGKQSVIALHLINSLELTRDFPELF